jgi:hypothetical protein
MTRLLVRLTAFMLLQAGIGYLVLPSALLQPRPGYLAALEDKLALLKADGPPRVVTVGGSSVAFGIDSPTIERGLDRPAVNLGLHGALGLDFYLRIAQRHSRPGDLIVLLPEYALLAGRHQMTNENVRRLLRNCPSAYRYLGGNLPSVKQYLDNVALSELAYWVQKGTLAQHGKLKRLIARRGRPAPRRTRTASRPVHPSVYRRSAFNRHGDMVAHHGMTAPENRQHHAEVPFDASSLARSVSRLNRCAAICRSRGATVVYSYPPVVDTTLKGSIKSVRQIEATLLRSLQMPIVNQPQSTAFHASQFFDTDKHLVRSAQQQRSRILLQGLTRELAARRRSPDHLRR